MAVLAVIFAGAAQAQSTLTGRVMALSDGERGPAAGAWVVASSGSPPRIVASVQTDADGAYRLGGLPEGRVEFTVSHRSYFTLEAGGATAPTLARACPASGSCGEADFVVAKASVVDGYVTDPFGDPLANITVRLSKAGESPETARRGRGPLRRGGFFSRPSESTDDRGYFRIYNVEPGDYELEASPTPMLSQVYSSDRVEVSVELGSSNPPLYIAMGVSAEPVRIAGVIDGLDLVGGESVRIMAANVNSGSSRRPMTGVQVDTEIDGLPRLSGQLAPGEYVLTAIVVDEGPGGRRLPGRAVTLGRYRIDSDTVDLRLSASAGAAFAGRIRYEDMDPRRADLNLVPLDGGTPGNMRFVGSGRFQGPLGGFGVGRANANEAPRFERWALLPGRYRLEAMSTDYFIASQTEFALQEGQTLETDIVLSGAWGEVRGTVRSPADSVGSGPFVVALRKPDGKIVSMQTDAEGQYSFARLTPGDYEIGAWVDRKVNPQNEDVWKTAGAAVRRFPVAAGDQTEILITAKP